MTRKWDTPANREALLALYRQGLTDEPIGKALGVSARVVAECRRAMGLYSNAGRPGPNLRALFAEATFGRCVACDGPLSARHGKLCGHPECHRVLHNAYKRDWCLKHPEKARAQQRAYDARRRGQHVRRAA